MTADAEFCRVTSSRMGGPGGTTAFGATETVGVRFGAAACARGAAAGFGGGAADFVAATFFAAACFLGAAAFAVVFFAATLGAAFFAAGFAVAEDLPPPAKWLSASACARSLSFLVQSPTL